MPLQTAPDKPARILVVDDEPINIQILSGILGAGYALNAATNGRKAVELACSQAPDLVLLDMMMPDMDGLEVCKKLQADPATREIPIIFVTGSSDIQTAEAGLEAGAVDFISKPVIPAIVKARVRTHIRNSRSSKFLAALRASGDMSIEEAREKADSLLD